MSMAMVNPLQAQTHPEAKLRTSPEHRLTSNLELHQVSTPEASLAVLRSLGQPGGIVTMLSDDCDSNKRRSVFLPWGLDIEGALDIIVPGGYSLTWSKDNAVVNIFPRGNVPGVMRVRIESFQWNTREHVRLVIGRLFVLEGVASHLAERRIASGLQFGIGLQKAPRLVGGVPQEEQSGQPYSLRDSTLLDALNRVVASYGRAVWMYTEKHCGGKREYQIFAQE